MESVRRIYTRTGDSGSTAIFGRVRVPKTDLRIEANGTIDELNVAVGAVRTSLPSGHAWQTILREIQLNLMTAMSLVATRSDMRDRNPNALDPDLIGRTEALIDSFAVQCPPSGRFILPGGTPRCSLIHQARVLARRAERCLWQLHAQDEVPNRILQYFNRLSDLFFEMARCELQQAGCQEEIWREFGYKQHLK